MIKYTIIFVLIAVFDFLLLKLCRKRIGNLITAVIIVVLLPILLYSLFMSVHFFFDLSLLNRVKEHNKVLDSIEKYYTDLGYYPVRLEEMVPKYIQEIPQLSGIKALIETQYFNNNVPKDKILVPFVGDNKPPFTFGIWVSLGISGNKFVRYCPKLYDCEYEKKIFYKNGKRLDKIEYEIRKPSRINNDWVVIRESGV